jgi:hypothetical protein
MHTPPTLILSRRPRRSGAVCGTWFGGLPKLAAGPGAAKWPRGKDGKPLHFAAQIDLAEVFSTAGDTGLPQAGSLAFFIGGAGPVGCVVYVPAGETIRETSPPTDTPDLEESGGDSDWPRDLAGIAAFPRWPMMLTKLNAPSHQPGMEYDDDALESFDAAVRRQFKMREYVLTPAVYDEELPRWWQTAHHLSLMITQAAASEPKAIQSEVQMLEWARKQLAEARQASNPVKVKDAEKSVAMYEKRLAEVRAMAPGVKAFAADVAAWVAGRDPWLVMTDDEWEQLTRIWRRLPSYSYYTHYWGSPDVSSLQQKTFDALPADTAPEFAALPRDVQTYIAARRAPHPWWWIAAHRYLNRLTEVRDKHLAQKRSNYEKVLQDTRRALQSLRPSGPFATLRGIAGRTPPADPQKVTALEAEIARHEKRLADMAALEPALRKEIDKFTVFVAGRDPWTRMTDEEVEAFAAGVTSNGTQLEELLRYRVPERLDQCERDMLVTIAGDDGGYRALPPRLRDRVDREFAMPLGIPHQMFGRPADIQGGAIDNDAEGSHLLLQLGHDDLLRWSFGDNGVYQFWISPQDLAARNWLGVRLTFECH